MNSPSSPARSAVSLLSTLRAGASLPLSCRPGASVLDAAGAVVGTITEIITGEWARVRWTDGNVSEVHGSRLDDVAAQDVTLAPLTDSAIEAHLSALGGGSVRIFERRGEGLVLVGWTTKLAALCGFKASGRVYFTPAKVRALLAAKRSA